MGSCIVRRERTIERPIPSADRLVYYRYIRLHVEMNNTPNYSSSAHSFDFAFDPPEHVNAQEVSLGPQRLYLSSCVLPGADPWSSQQKPCQDGCFFEKDDRSLLVGVYDGHGKNGRDVVKFCKDFVVKKFREDVGDPPPVFLTRITKQCGQSILAQNEFDVSLSGTTQILVYIADDTVCIANVGDSKAVIATRCTNPEDSMQYEETRTETLDRISSLRKIPESQILPAQLTKSHVPTDLVESERIKLCGGRIRQLAMRGKPFGPHRVWCRDSNKPGLAMTRSLGDSVATELGVICTPNVKHHEIIQNDDYFLIVATDGLWNVMNHFEAIDFVQEYRCKTLTKTNIAPEEVRPSNACIAHLLCEEARLRWLAVVEEERAIIDDIACVIIEFSKDPIHSLRPARRMSVVIDKQKHTPVKHTVRQESGLPIEASEVRLYDHFRSSNVQERDEDSVCL